MRTSYLLAGALACAVGLAGLVGAVVPAAAESEGASAACAPAADPGTLNLDAIPVQPVTGKLSVGGVGDDDEDCGPRSGEHSDGGDDD